MPESVYGPNRKLTRFVLRRFGVETTFYPPTIGASIESLFKPNTRLVWCESPGSITMEVQDVPAIAEVAHAHGALVVMDNTWAAGVLFDALAHGVDITMQAVTKYIGGHSDLLLGAITVKDEAAWKTLGAHQQVLGCGGLARRLQPRAARHEDHGGAAEGHRSLGAAHRRVAQPTAGGRTGTASRAAVVPRA